MIDREALFGNPDRAMVQVSPDGRWISYLAPDAGVLNLWVAPVDALHAARCVTQDRGRGIAAYAWAASSERLLVAQDTGGDENWRLHAVDPQGGNATDLTPFEGVQAHLIGVSPRHPHHVVVGLNDRDPQLHDPWRIDVRTGERRRLIENPGLVHIRVDWDLEVCLGILPAADGSQQVQRLTPDGWTPVADVALADTLTTAPLAPTADGETWYWLDSRSSNTTALIAEDVATGERRVLAVDPEADIGGILTHPTTGVIQAAFSTYDVRRRHIIDPAVAPHLDRLAAAKDGEADVLSRSDDDQVWVVAWIREDGPIPYSLYRPATGQIEDLFLSRTQLQGVPLARRRPQILTSRDGLSLVSYLSLPRDQDQDGRPPAPLPMVLVVHGGPWARDEPGYDSYHQFLADRGYAVLSVNFRGSTGFGKDFISAGDLQWAAKMHDDLLDAVDWAIDAGIARRDAVAIMGASYGGYATLVGLTFTPEVFACGVDIVGPSNLITLLQSIPPYWAPLRAQFTQRMGDDGTEEGRALLWSRSPLSRVDAITKPLLIAQGANDPRVKQAESDQIVAAMRQRDIAVTYALCPDEGHGFARPENRIGFMALVEAFLAEHLGGRAQPMGDVLAASSIELS